MISVIFDSINTSQHEFLENNKFECNQASYFCYSFLEILRERVGV